MITSVHMCGLWICIALEMFQKFGTHICACERAHYVSDLYMLFCRGTPLLNGE